MSDRRLGLELTDTTIDTTTIDPTTIGTTTIGTTTDVPRTGRLDRHAVDRLRNALLRHKVLVFRARHLDGSAHRRLLQHLGTPARAAAPDTGRWLAPGSERVAPPRVISLRATDAGGPLHLAFADVAGAYRDLPRALRSLADRSWAVHEKAAGEGEEPVAHPVTRLHTETGDRGLLLGPHARSVLGLGDDEGRAVLHLLQSYVTRPHNVLAVTCAPGDLVIADARAVQVHLPAGARWLELAGDPPLGVDGRHSHLLRRVVVPPHPISA